MKKFFKYLDYIIESSVALLFLIMVVVGAMQVFNRFVLGSPLSWSEEVQKYANIWLIFLTIPICYRRGRHIGMEILTNKFPASLRNFISYLIDVLWFSLGVSIIIYIHRIMQVAKMQYSPALEIRMDYVYLGEMLGGIYLCITALRMLCGRFMSQSENAKGVSA